MKIINLSEFLELPSGVVFQIAGDSKKFNLEDICVKEETLGDNSYFFWRLLPNWNLEHNKIEFDQTSEKKLIFDKTTIFVIYERKDVQNIIEILLGISYDYELNDKDNCVNIELFYR